MTAENIVEDFIHSYRQKMVSEPDAVWLARKLKEVSSEGEYNDSDAKEIVASVDLYRAASADLAGRLERGESRARYLQDTLTRAAKAAGVSNVGQYAGGIDEAVSRANQMMWDTVHRKDGGINQAHTLHGNIAEAYLAGDGSIRQAAVEEGVTTVQPRVNEEGSADTRIVDELTGRIFSEQQMKFYSSPKRTLEAYLSGDYVARGQSLVAPADQVQEIRQLANQMGIAIDVRASVDGGTDGLTYNQALKLAKACREKGIFPQRDWCDADVGLISRHVGMKAVSSGILAMGLQAARIIGRRIWNGAVGRRNPSVEKDLTEFGESAVKSGACAGVTAAVAGGLTVAARRGLLGRSLVASSASVIGGLACVAVENVKIFSELGTGKITTSEALDKSCNNTCSLVGSLVVGAKAAVVGTALAPGIGTVVGGVVGSLVGSVAGQSIYQGARTAVRAVGNFVSRVAKGVGSVVSRAWSAVRSWFA